MQTEVLTNLVIISAYQGSFSQTYCWENSGSKRTSLFISHIYTRSNLYIIQDGDSLKRENMIVPTDQNFPGTERNFQNDFLVRVAPILTHTVPTFIFSSSSGSFNSWLLNFVQYHKLILTFQQMESIHISKIKCPMLENSHIW